MSQPAAPANDNFSARLFEQPSFRISAPETRLLPDDGIPEVAFVGRSNAGKSSALNTVTRHGALARVSRTPGRTQQLNVFDLGDPVQARIVDLPGYGFAKVPLAERGRWDRMIGAYLTGRPALAGLVVVMDIRRPLTDLDWQLLGPACGTTDHVPVHLLLTKADKLSKNQAIQSLFQAQKEAGARGLDATLQTFSALHREGVDDLRDVILGWWRDRRLTA